MDTNSINIALAIVASLAVFLAVVAIKAAKANADKLESLQYAHSMAQEHARVTYGRLSDRVDSAEKTAAIATESANSVNHALDIALENRANANHDLGRVFHKVHSLAAHLGLYWDEQCRWTHSDGLVGSNAAGAQCAQSGVASGNTIRGAKARGRRA